MQQLNTNSKIKFTSFCEVDFGCCVVNSVPITLASAAVLASENIIERFGGVFLGHKGVINHRLTLE